MVARIWGVRLRYFCFEQCLGSSTIGFSFVGTSFFSAIYLKRADWSGLKMDQGVSPLDLIFHNILLKQKIKGKEPARFRQSSSWAKVTDASRDLGCDPWSFHHPRSPYQYEALTSAGGVHIRRSGLLRHVATFNVRSQRQNAKILIFCYSSILFKKK